MIKIQVRKSPGAPTASRGGFTLVEVLVSVGIIVLLTAMVLAGVLWLMGMPHLKADTDAVTHAGG